ncbi:M20 family metallopeptidase [Kitasatospora camelliae]|uniref:M20 family metallopeptidase n=1 Tax=Kitasatospora camelliae TaxID=3156397 RepID=A0AAU8K0P5_9ACTN
MSAHTVTSAASPAPAAAVADGPAEGGSPSAATPPTAPPVAVRPPADAGPPAADAPPPGTARPDHVRAGTTAAGPAPAAFGWHVGAPAATGVHIGAGPHPAPASAPAPAPAPTPAPGPAVATSPAAKAPAAPAAPPSPPGTALDGAATAALPGLPQALSTRARTLAGAVRRRCADLARMESPSGDAPRLDALAEELAAGFRATGAEVRREAGPAGDHLVLHWPGRHEELPHLLVVGHHDTVWPAGTLDEWPVEERDGRLSGPGVLDMKAGLALLEGAFALLADLGQRPHRPVRLVVVSDEEVGSPDGKRLVERQLRGAAAVLGLEPAHPDGRLKTARRGSTRVRLTVTGREAHAGNDAAHGVSAVDELVDQLVAVRGLAHQPGTELNAGRITGGTRANVIAGRAEAELGLRFSTTEAQRRTLDHLARLTALRPGAKVRTEVLSSRPAWPERSGNPLLRHVRSLAAALGQQLDGAPAGGAGDTNLAGARGLPTLDGLGAVGAGPHARHEHIRVDQLAPRIALLAALLAVPLPRLRS